MPEAYAFSTIPAKILLPIDFSPSSHNAIEQATVVNNARGGQDLGCPILRTLR